MAAAAPRPNSSTPPGAGTGVPPELDDVLEPPLDVEVEVDVVLEPPVELEVDEVVDVEVVLVVVLEPPVDVDVLDDELFDDLLDLDDLLLLELFELLVDFVLFVDLVLLLDWQKMKHLLDFELLLNQLVALASVGVAATTPAVAIEAPITAACVILMYCIVPSPKSMAPTIRRLHCCPWLSNGRATFGIFTCFQRLEILTRLQGRGVC